MLISRPVGTVSSLITVFLPDRTVSTGAGLANVIASTVRMTWLRSDMAAVSSWTLTTGTLGAWAASTMTQVGSTSTLGAYQFSLPNGLFASGDNAYVQIMSSTATFAEVPIVIELTKTDNQSYLSTQIVGFVQNGVRVTTFSAGVSSITTPVTASSVTAPVGVSTLPAITSMTVGVNVTSIHGSAAVTSAAGVLGPSAVSSLTTPVTVSAGVVRASSATVTSLTVEALRNFFNVGATTFAGAVVSSVVFEIANNAQATVGAVEVSAFTVGALGQFFTTDAGDYSTSVLGSIVQEIADNVSATVGAQVGVSSISIPVSVSAIAIPVSVSSGTVGVSSYANESGIIHKGTAQGGSGTTIILAATTSSYANDIPNGSAVYIASGAGAGQTRNVDDWESSSMTATVSPAWTTNPTSTSVYQWFASPPSSGQVAVSTITVSAMSSFFTLDAGDYSTSVLGSVVQEIADNVSATVGAQVGVSSISIPVSVSAVGIPVSVSGMSIGVNVTSIVGSAAVTSAAGVLGPVRVSSISIPVGVSTGVLAVSAATIPFGVSSIATPVTASSVTRLVGFSTATIPVGVSTGSIEVSSATASVNEAMADAFLNRNISSGGNGTRPVYEAFFAIRNRVDLSTGIVYATDDTTQAWTFAVSTTPGDPIYLIDPS